MFNNKTFIQFEKTVGEFEKLKGYPEYLLTEPIAKGKWSIREIVGHMFYWDKFNLENMVPYISNGAKLFPFPDHDSQNREAVSYIDKFDSVTSIIDAFVKTRKKLIENIIDIESSVRFEIENEPYEFSTENFVEIFVEHDSHHLKQIQKHLGKSLTNEK